MRARLAEQVEAVGDTLTDLSAFQRDLLFEVIRLSNQLEDPPHGLAIKERIQAEYGSTPINNGRLYTNLDKLVEMGLIEKRRAPADERANIYTPTKRAHRECKEHMKCRLSTFTQCTIQSVLEAIVTLPESLRRLGEGENSSESVES